MPQRNLCSGFLIASEKFPDRPALEVEGRVLTYRELRDHAEAMAATLVQFDAAGDPPLTAVFGYRSAVAFSGVLAALLRGHGYVPLNRTFPADRTALMLERSGCRAVVVDRASAAQLDQILPGIDRDLVLLLPEMEDVSALAAAWPRLRILGARDLAKSSPVKLPILAPPDAIAYLLFTSGSTGAPKGVTVAQRNVLSYLDFVVPRYGLTSDDRCSQTFDMTFDLSVHDMFVTWQAGACLCCPSQKTLIQPGRFILESRLTAWFSVPSTAIFMKKLGALKPRSYPSLRLSLFCGEALPMELAKGWSEAAPNSIVENIYGPTELTIACTAYRWDALRSLEECELGIVPIGEPFEGLTEFIANEELGATSPGEAGELLIAGPQVTPGYWQDAEKTSRAFVVPPGKTEVFYRTGDRVRRQPGRPLVYMGRVDNQIKVLGHRVELGEIEAAVREESGIDGVVAVGWPRTSSGAGGIEVFLQAEKDYAAAALRERLSGRLPAYMTPRRIHCVPALPLNSNGKFDRNAVLRMLEQEPPG